VQGSHVGPISTRELERRIQELLQMQ